jgi:thymidylate kinase
MLTNHRLVVGIDGSGKSTLLAGLNQRDGAEIKEVTSSPEARSFKRSAIERYVDSAFVSERQMIFLKLNRVFDSQVSAILDSGVRVVTTGSSLVTLVSHSLMTEIVTGTTGRVDGSVRRWIDDSESLKPDQIILVHAPDEVIRSRIIVRQDESQSDERFWGFNAPYFLSRYQESWHGLMGMLINEGGIDCVSLDSSVLSPIEMVDKLL